MGGFADYSAEIDEQSGNSGEDVKVLPFPEPDSIAPSPNTSTEFRDPSFAKLKSGKFGVRTKNPDAKKGDTVTVHRRDGGVAEVVLGRLIETNKYGERVFSIEKKPKD